MGSLCEGKGEYAGRCGGEEILLVMLDADGCAAERVLKLHLAIRHHTLRVPGSPIPSRARSAWAGDGDSWESLAGRADAALYQARRDGRDRVAESETPLDPSGWSTAHSCQLPVKDRCIGTNMSRWRCSYGYNQFRDAILAGSGSR